MTGWSFRASCRDRTTRVTDAKPAYDAAMKTARPALQALYRDTFAKNKLDAIAFPTVPKVAIASNPDSSSLANFLLFIQNTDPGSNAGVPGIQLPIALGASTQIACRSRARRARGKRSQVARDRHGDGEADSAGYPRPRARPGWRR